MRQELKKLNLGCGPGKHAKDWIHLDGSWNARLAKHPRIRNILKTFHILPNALVDMPWAQDIFIHDLRKPLPFDANSMEAIYSSHTLEHLYLEEAKRLLKECYRVLKPGGILRIVLPDLKAMVQEYIDEQSHSYPVNDIYNDTPADRLNVRLNLRMPNSAPINIFHRIYTAMTDFHTHKWMYDAESLTYYFQKSNFINIQEMKCYESRIKGIDAVETELRILNGAGLCIEGLKPP